MSELKPVESPEQLINLINQHLQAASQANLIPLIAIVGPTASGKTALGIALAKLFQGEIISADSRQIYQQMDIGTAKPTKTEQQNIKHHLIDLIKPDQLFSLSDYQNLASQTILNIFKQDKRPFLVGGTGLYINALTQNYILPSSKPDLKLRQELEELAAHQGKQAVHQLLKELDPLSAEKIHANNLRYVIRALEIAKQTAEPKNDQIRPSPYHTFYLTIAWPRSELYRRIEERIDQQIEEGLIAETQKLLAKYNPNLPSMSSLGYKEIGEYLTGQSDLLSALNLFKQNTRNYAKRQLTWFRKIKPLYSISGNSLVDFISALKKA